MKVVPLKLIGSCIAGNVTINQLQKEVLFKTKGLYMKESNTLQRDILLDTKGECTKELNALAGNVTIKQGVKESNTLGAMQPPSNFKGTSCSTQKASTVFCPSLP